MLIFAGVNIYYMNTIKNREVFIRMLLKKLFGLAIVFFTIAAVVGINPSQSQTLEEALINAYLTNPALQAARAGLRARDETVNQAKSGWRPNVEFEITSGVNNADQNSTSSNSLRRPRSGTVSLEQKLYDGGQISAETEQRIFEVKAERAELENIEQNVLLSASTAYMNVVRGQAVSQAEARVARAKSKRIQAEREQNNSRTNFERIVGSKPSVLISPRIKEDLPKSLKDAIDLAVKFSPSLVSSFYWQKAAKANIRKVMGELMPNLSIDGTLSTSKDQSFRGSSSDQAMVLATLTIPIYQQGSVHSRVRQAKHELAHRRLKHEDILREVIEKTQSTWEDLVSARARIDAFNVEIKSSEIALDGVRQEADVGSRTVLDVLDAEQELLDAQVNLVRAQRDEFVGIMALKASIGKLTAKQYNLDVDYYKETEHYNKVRDKIYGLGK